MAQPQELTTDEFIKVFGMTPQEYEQRNPDRVTTNVPQKPKQRRYGSRAEFDAANPAVLDAARAMSVAQPTQPQQAPRDRGNEIDFVGNELSLMPDFMQQAQANIGAGVLALPSSMAGFADLVRLGIPAVVNGYMNADDELSVFDAIADEFSNSVISPEDQQKLEDIQRLKLSEFDNSNPTATQEQRDAFLREYANSDEFYNEVTQKMSWGMRLASQGQTWANERAGLGKRADQMSAGDEAMQAISSAFVGLPPAAARAIGQRITATIGNRITDSVIAKTIGRVAEVVTPITLPLTPGNVALNAGAGVALGEGIRELQGAPTLIDYEKFYNPTENADPAELIAATGVTAASFLSIPGVMRALRKEIADDVTERAKNVGQKAGPTLEEQSDDLTPVLSPTTGVLDETSPLTHGAQKFGADGNTVSEIEAMRSAASTVNRVQAENNALNYGMLENSPDTVPFVHIQQAVSRMSPETLDVLDKYVYAVQRKQDSAMYEKSLLKQVSDLRLRVEDQHKAYNAASGNARKREENRLSQLTTELNDTMQKYSRLINDDPTMRSSMRGTPEKGYADGWSRSDVDTFIRAGESIPEVKAIGDAFRKISGDITDFLHRNGVISAEEATRRKATRELYVPLQEAKYANKGPLARRALLFKDKFKKTDTDQGFFISTTPRNVTGEGSVVNRPKSAMVAMQEGIMDAVRAATVNNARRDIIDTMRALPNAEGKLLRAYEFDLGNGRKSKSISPEQFAHLYSKGFKDEDKYVRVFRNGNIEMWEMSDQSMTRSLQMAPISTIPILNGTRKFWQSMTTGPMAPWFAAKSFIWDAPLGQITKQSGRSLGLIDTFARRLAQGTALERPVNAVADRLFDPTVFLASAMAIPQQIGLRAMKAVGDKIAADLATNSGIFHKIANSSPEGAQYVKHIGMFMASAFDNSALGMMSRNMSTSIAHMNDVSRIYDDFARATTQASRLGSAALTPISGYKAMLDSVHMSTRYAFFSSNYGRLQLKYGKGKVPQSEIRKLVQETRNLTGDMSRQSNSKWVQELTSVVPYSNAMIQGTRHILSSAIPQPLAKGVNRIAGGNLLENRDTRFWSQFVTGLLVPKIAALSFMSQWEDAEDYWYNKTPKWMQMSHIPIPHADVILEAVQSGQMPAFDPSKLHKVPISPEFSMIMEPAMAALRAMGVVGTPQLSYPSDISSGIKDVMDHITGFATPPLLKAAFAWQGQRLDLHGMLTGGGGAQDIRNTTHGGANADMMTHNSIVPSAVYEMIGALGGSAAQIAMQTFNVFDISNAENDDFTKALGDALDVAGFEIERRLPQVPNGGLWQSRERLYAFTPESQYVYQTLNDLDPIIGSGRQLSVERDRKSREAAILDQGLLPAAKLKDQNLLNISGMIHETLNKSGPFKEAREMLTDVRSLIAALEASRHKMSQSAYNDRRNIYVERQQELIRVQSEVLQELENNFQQSIGPQFEQMYGMPFSYSNLSKLVRKDVRGR